MNSKQYFGFSLVELMIVVAIVGFLVSVAYPSYLSYLNKGGRSEAIRELAKISNLQEQYFADHRTYVTDLTLLGLASKTVTTETNKYLITVSPITDITSDYLLTATVQGVQVQDSSCTAFSLNHIGQRAAINDQGNDSTQNCWGLE